MSRRFLRCIAPRTCAFIHVACIASHLLGPKAINHSIRQDSCKLSPPTCAPALIQPSERKHINSLLKTGGMGR
eukprot:3750727-Alexandrium_andersonii.AAC.1